MRECAKGSNTPGGSRTPNLRFRRRVLSLAEKPEKPDYLLSIRDTGPACKCLRTLSSAGENLRKFRSRAGQARKIPRNEARRSSSTGQPSWPDPQQTFPGARVRCRHCQSLTDLRLVGGHSAALVPGRTSQGTQASASVLPSRLLRRQGDPQGCSERPRNGD
jgi:hypothetical protein